MSDHKKHKRIVEAVSSVLRNGKSKTDVVAEFTKPKVVDYPVEQELYDRILSLVHEYDGEISFASCVGVLELAKNELSNTEI